MPMNIEAQWHPPLELVEAGEDANLIYSCPRAANIPDEPGVYVFGRRHGEFVAPLYIGRSKNLQTRLYQHLDSVPLMKAIQRMQNGSRFYLYCTVTPKPGQRIDRVLDVLERALIDHAMTTGHELLQKQGTRTAKHTISFRGNHTATAIVPRSLYARVT